MSGNDGEQQAAMRLMAFFPTVVGQVYFPDHAERKEQWVERIRTLRSQDKEGRDLAGEKYRNGYTSYFTHNDLFNDPAFAELTAFLQSSAQEYAARQYWDVDNCDLVMTSLWCNINGEHSYHADHVHPYSHISGVFYIDCPPGSSSISFKDPRVARWMVPPPTSRTIPENTLLMTLDPEEGKLLMFPSFLEHRVTQHAVNAERISMSFNFELRARAG